jgi:hypothetical protein
MPPLRRGQLHNRVEDVDNQDITAGGVPTRLWLMKVPPQLSPRNTVAGAASVIKLDTTNKRVLRRTLPLNEVSPLRKVSGKDLLIANVFQHRSDLFNLKRYSCVMVFV